MKKHITISFLSVLFLLLASGCNSEIFTENKNLRDITQVTIEGDGGQWSTPFSRQGLKDIYFNFGAEDYDYARYYSVKGGEVDATCPPSELDEVQVDSPIRMYGIWFEGDMIYVHSTYNASSTKDWIIQLDYEDGTRKTIRITITAGEPLQHWYGFCTGNINLEEDVQVGAPTHTMRFANNSPLAQKLEVKPYLDARCGHMVSSEERWAQGLPVDIAMPEYLGGLLQDEKWGLHDFETDMQIGKSWYSTPYFPSSYVNETLTVDVPPNTTATVKYNLHYTRASVTGIVKYYNVEGDCSYDVDVLCTSVYPTSYDYTVEYE